jgi:tetratricopeptide (TPR) repeat protein
MPMNRSHDHFQGGIENYNLGLLPQAKMCFLDCIQCDPGHAEALNLLGLVCYRRQEFAELKYYEEAKSYFFQAIDIAPLYPDPYSNLGNLFSDCFLWDDAVRCYKQALTLNPFFAEACFNLALVLEKKYYHIEAVYYYQQTLKMRPAYLKAHQRLAELLIAQQRLDEGREHSQEAVRLRPQQKCYYINTPFWTAPAYKGLF